MTTTMPTPARPSRPVALLLAAALLAGAAPAPAADPAADPADRGYDAVRRLMSESRSERREAAREIRGADALALVPGMVDAYFFVPRNRRAELRATLAELTGEAERDTYHDWVEFVGAHPEIEPHPGYLQWKVELLERIDPRYGQILYPAAPTRIRLEEVVWGGVPIAGIPAVVDPETVPGADADRLKDDELVYGVALGGTARAYPQRVLSWHEMLNDTVGGVPVALSYCTLCGSAVLYSTATPAGTSYTLGTSGLLYRSNKLMFDSESLSLWSNLTGEPVIGRLATTDAELEVLPMTRTTWADWRARHPDTDVLDLDWLEEKFAAYRFDYTPGAADRAREGVSFPVWQSSDRLPRDAEIYALRVGSEPMAYLLDAVLEAGVVHDEVGGREIVLVADPGSGAVRAFASDGRAFRRGDDDSLVDGGGVRWRVGEEALTPAGGTDATALPEPLPRVPGHVAFWFGWFGFYPETGVWSGGEPAGARDGGAGGGT